MSEKIKVQELWWEDDDLHVLDADDKHWIFSNAYFSDYKLEFSPSDSIQVTDEFIYERIQI